MNNNVTSKSFKSNKTIVIVSAVAVVALVAAIVILVSQQTKAVNDFAQCKTAGGAIMQTYPEQCTVNGKTFTNSAQSGENSGNSSEYIGLSETEALAKAKQDNVAARVVERDGESFPSTEDFSPGRHNLSIKDGKVYKDSVEE